MLLRRQLSLILVCRQENKKLPEETFICWGYFTALEEDVKLYLAPFHLNLQLPRVHRQPTFPTKSG